MASVSEQDVIMELAENPVEKNIVMEILIMGEYYNHNLNWCNGNTSLTRNRRSYCRNACFENLSENVKNCSMEPRTMKLIESKFVKYPDKTLELNLNSDECSKSTEVYVPGVPASSVNILPQHSLMSRSDMLELFKYLYRLRYKNPLNEEQLQDFNNLMAKAKLDHGRFQEFARMQWVRNNVVRTTQIPKSILQFVDVFWKAKVTECLSLYPTLYCCRSDIPLVLNDPNKDFAVLDFQKHLLTLGRPPRMSLPCIKYRCDLVTNFDDLCSIKPVTVPEHNYENLLSKKLGDIAERMFLIQPITRRTSPVSEDVNIEKCMQMEDVDVVISSSGIKTLVDCYSLNEWILPITVKSIPNPNKPEVNKKVVFVDKKMPPVSMSNHDKNLLHTKVTAKWAYILNSNRNLLPDRTSNKNNSTSVGEENGSDDQPFENQSKKNKAIRPCHEYSVWNLHKSTHYNMSKNEQRPVNILIRSRKEGKLLHFISKGRNRCLEDVCVSSKVEFQPEYGASVMSKRELLREYVDLYLQKNAKLLRARSVGFTQELMLSEIISLGEIRDKLVELRVVPHSVFDSLYAVLTKLIDLPEGKYLLHHNTTMGCFAQLLTHSEKGSTFNLEHYLRELKVKDCFIPPVNIDPLTLTGIHHKNRAPPAVFRPFNQSSDNRLLKNSFGKSAKHLKKKYLKKRKNKKKHKEKCNSTK